MIHPGKFDAALRAAGIPIHGCASDGRIDFRDEATDEQRRLALEIKSQQPSFNPNVVDYAELREREYPSIKDCVVALLENEEGRPEALTALMKKRAEIKTKYPKP